MTDAEIIDALGGPAEVADILCVSRQLIHNYKRRGIPWLSRFAFAFIADRKKIRLPEAFLERNAYDRAHKRRKAKK